MIEAFRFIIGSGIVLLPKVTFKIGTNFLDFLEKIIKDIYSLG